MDLVFHAITGGSMKYSYPPPSHVSQFVQVSYVVHKRAKSRMEFSKLVSFNTDKYQNYSKALYFSNQCNL